MSTQATTSPPYPQLDNTLIGWLEDQRPRTPTAHNAQLSIYQNVRGRELDLINDPQDRDYSEKMEATLDELEKGAQESNSSEDKHKRAKNTSPEHKGMHRKPVRGPDDRGEGSGKRIF